MSTIYLIDQFGNPLPSAKIIDVVSEPGPLLNGAIPVRVPDYISVQNPINVTDLITKKHQGMLAYYAGYSNVLFDDLMDTVAVDLAAPNTVGFFGERNQITISPSGRLTSTTIPLGGPNPPEVIVTWETYEVQTIDPKTDRTAQVYVERPSTPSYFTCEVSFDNGAHFYPTTDGALLNIPLVGQGTQFIIRLTNNTPPTDKLLRLGSWALVY